MSADMVELFDALKQEVTTTVAGGKVTAIALNTTTLTTAGGTDYTLATTTAADGKTSTITVKGGVFGTTAVDLVSITHGATSAADAAGTATYTLNLDAYNFVDTSDLEAVSTATQDPSKATVDIFNTAAKSGGVSNSDAFDQSTAIMTYANNITLQVGARTKDAVNFTFEYNKDGTADMGDLKANLNLSARKDGLNTENLSLATAKDANHAIDQIDKAINKTSMVRASFGSIQNRLEHKITNLTTTSENLTEAESSIRDTDMASEMMNYTKFNILQQAAQSMLAQANQQPQSILQLLG